MPKVKIPRKSTSVDMTAMCDVSFLLLTFFILTSKFKPTEPVAIDLPNSRSSIQVNDAIKISVDKNGKAYINYPSATFRLKTLEKMGEYYKDKYPQLTQLTDKQKNNFAQVETFGFDSKSNIPELLSKKPDEISKMSTGIPMDSLDNQLGDWIQAGRYADVDINHPTANGAIRIAIKGDKQTDVKAVQQVIKTLTDNDIHTFNLITTLAGGSTSATADQK
ncbi:MAG: biopolymer transporter ExbD [Bacteroidetes bacterium]|nr:biopolymer transporter ExbD [Bacteroidota bacterium]